MTDDRYADAGVDIGEADKGINQIVQRIKSTWPAAGFGAVRLDIGYFANVIDFGGIGLALCTDGVGSKTALCKMMNRYDTIGIDCVAMNVNDLICVGARPVSMLDYIGVEKADEEMLGQIAIGLAEGARQAGISISGGEVAQLPGIIHDFDLVGAAVGRVPLDRINTGSEVAPEDVVIGIASNGIHSNGLSLVRKIMFNDAHVQPDDPGVFPELGMSLGAELLRPTAIYVREVLQILDSVPVKALANITGDGLLNLLRINRNDAGFVLEQLPQPPPIFKLIQHVGNVAAATMYEVFNMGIGFCIVVEKHYASAVMTLLSSYGRQSWQIGHVVPDKENTLYLPAQGLVGRGKHFHPRSRMEIPSL